jgi:hypothetical protein
MTEAQVLFQISKIVNRDLSSSQAMEKIRHLLEREADRKALILETGTLKDTFEARDLLNSVELRIAGRHYQIARSEPQAGVRRLHIEDVGAQEGVPPPATRKSVRKGPNAGGRSAWMRGFFDRPSPPLWKAIRN